MISPAELTLKRCTSEQSSLSKMVRIIWGQIRGNEDLLKENSDQMGNYSQIGLKRTTSLKTSVGYFHHYAEEKYVGKVRR